MILCVNLNAAIDKTIVVDSFQLGSIHRPQSVRMLAGGKGCNVARALKTFGHTPVVTGWVGGKAGEFIEAQLQLEGIATEFVYTEGESRTCTSILDSRNQRMTEIYEYGHPVPSDKLEEMITRFEEMVDRCSAVTLSGSLPPGVPDDIYHQLILAARLAEVPVFLDSSKEALRRGLEARPILIKPNESEIRTLVNRQLRSLEDFTEAATLISEQYQTVVVLSLGRQGAIVAGNGQSAMLRIPPVDAVSAVGSGDCLLAGVVHGFNQGLDLIECVKIGAAAGTANTLKIGAGHFSMGDFNDIYKSIIVENPTPY